MDVEKLLARFDGLVREADQAHLINTRVGVFTAVKKAKEAAAVADLIGGAVGASRRANAELVLCSCLFCVGNMAAAADGACSALRAARAAGSTSFIVLALMECGKVANKAPDEMAKAERQSRDQERLGGSTLSYGGLDLSQEGRVCLPTTPAALSRLAVAYGEAAVATCDAALAAVGGRDSAAGAAAAGLPSLCLEGDTRGRLGLRLCQLGVERQRGLDLLREAVVLLRRAVRMAASNDGAREEKRTLAACLCNLGAVQPFSDGVAEAAVCLRQALELSEDMDDVGLTQVVMINLANMSGRPDQPVGLAEAAALRLRLNALYAQTGRIPDTSCTICLEPLEQPGGGAEKGAADDCGRDADGFTNSSVYVMICGRQFHRRCVFTWRRKTLNTTCPLCRLGNRETPPGGASC